jgi:archaellum component FlaG (FlaF/FlaG flagellin family)
MKMRILLLAALMIAASAAGAIATEAVTDQTQGAPKTSEEAETKTAPPEAMPTHAEGQSGV